MSQRNKRVSVFNMALLRDPTRTGRIRLSYIAELRRRFKKAKQLITKSVHTNDALDLATNQEALGPKAFAFSTDPEKFSDFIVWLNEMLEKEILFLETGPTMRVVDERWADTYVSSAYSKGIQRGYEELAKRSGNAVFDSLVSVAGGPARVRAVATMAQGALFQPIHLENVRLLYQRNFAELKGVTESMAQQISRSLAQGLAEGKNPRVVAREMVKLVDIGLKRATTIARTEIVRAHVQGALNTYKSQGIEGVTVLVEWSTAIQDVCPDCADLEGRVFTLDEISGLIPLHPNCRCVPIPFIPGIEDVTPRRKPIIGAQYKNKKGVAKLRGFYRKKTGKNPPPRRKVA